MKKLVIIAFGLSISNAFATELNYWQDTQQTKRFVAKASGSTTRLLSLNNTQLEQHLQTAKSLTLPLPNGEFTTVNLTETSILPANLAAKYPKIHTFIAKDPENGKTLGRVEYHYNGLRAAFVHDNNTIVIEPTQATANNGVYRSVYKSQLKSEFNKTQDILRRNANILSLSNNRVAKSTSSSQSQDKIFRIAFSASGEYTAMYGGTKAGGLSAITTIVNRLNEIYHSDLGVKLVLAENADAVIFTDAANDPFQNDDNDIDANTKVLNDNIGEANYDIGHVINTNGGGLAQLAAVCTSYKAEGMTGIPSTDESFIVDYVAHEVGHQFGADHSFNTGEGSCGDNRVQTAAFEPGSGSTIMSYAGICGSTDLQMHSDDFFHAISLQQINQFLVSLDSSCGQTVTTTNQSPIVNAGQDMIVPAQTPFILTATGSDADNDSLTYGWEQFDQGDADGAAPTAKTDMVDNGVRPLFRSFKATSSPSRTLPKMADILANKSSIGETYATTNRDLHFRVTVRDGKGGVAFDDKKVTVVADNGAFVITEPISSTVWKKGENLLVRWQVAGTDKAPYNCSQINIDLSTDGGNSFSKLATVPNNGEYQAAVPDINSERARIKLSCNNQIFFAISNGNFRIDNTGSTTPNQPPQITGQQAISVDEDNSITLSKAQLIYTDVDNTDAQLTMNIGAGEHYRFNGLTITPEADFNGVIQVPVTLNDGQASSASFSLSITVNAVNDAPIANDDTITVDFASSNNTIDVLANDSDIDVDDTLTLVSASADQNGQVSISNGKLMYSPKNDFSGTEIITYQIQDSQSATADAKVTVTVNAKPAPSPTTPTATSSSSGGSVHFSWLALLWLISWRNNKQQGVK